MWGAQRDITHSVVSLYPPTIYLVMLVPVRSQSGPLPSSLTVSLALVLGFVVSQFKFSLRPFTLVRTFRGKQCD